jgi:site-specific recombinase XerC
MEVLEVVLKGKRLRPKTQKNYRMAFVSLAKFSEEFPVDSVVINEWIASLSGYEDGTVRCWFAFINAGGKYMKKVFKVVNPCEDAERPKVHKKRRRYFAPAELVAIIRACSTDYELLLVLTLIDSACRIGELIGLKGKDVGDGFIDVSGKTGQRRYRLNPKVCERLKVLAGGDNEPVFRHDSGGFYPSGDGLGHRVRRIAERAGLTGARLGVHTIRHSSASLIAKEFREALVVKALLQHDDLKTSMGYIHDVEDGVVRDEKYSPLRLLAEQYGESKQGVLLPDGSSAPSTALVPAGSAGLVAVEGAELAGDLFPEVKAGVAVRTVLREDDLLLIRKAFMFYAQYNDGNEVSRARLLMRRMLRKGGSERYSQK